MILSVDIFMPSLLIMGCCSGMVSKYFSENKLNPILQCMSDSDGGIEFTDDGSTSKNYAPQKTTI